MGSSVASRRPTSRRPASRRRGSARRTAPGWTGEERTLWLLAAVPPVVMWSATSSVFAIPKLVAVALLATALLAARAGRPLLPGPLASPVRPAVVAAAAFVVVAGLAVATSDAPWLSLFGHQLTDGRAAGWFTYLVGVTLFVLAATVADPARVHARLLQGVGVGAGVVMVVAALQHPVVGVLEWADYALAITGSPATLGNPNLVAAHAGIAVAISGGSLLADRTWDVRRAVAVALLVVGFLLPWGATTLQGRALALAVVGAGLLVVAAIVLLLAGGPVGLGRGAAAALLFLAFLGALAAGSQQGFAAAIVGLLTGALVAMVRRWPARRRQLGLGALGAALLAAVGAAMGASGRGPLALLMAGRPSTDQRLWDWQAALGMAADHPFTGVGFDRFGAYVPAYRPVEAAGSELISTHAHNVPLTMLAAGGIPLVLAYLAVVAITGWALVVGLGRVEAPYHRLLGILGAAWVAYQVQSFVSLDVPSLLVTHWLLAGAIVALVALPADPRRRPRPARGAPRRGYAAVGAVAGVVLFVVPSLVLLVADLAAGDGERALAAEDAATAIDGGERASRIAGWEPRYHAQRAFGHGMAGDLPAARDALLDATAADERALSPQINLARVAVTMDDRELAAERFLVVVALEPNDVALHREAATAIRLGVSHAAALEVLEDLVQRRPDSQEARALYEEFRTAAENAAARG